MSAASIPRPLLVLLAVAAGASVANVYYAQPLLDQLARAFALDRAVAGAVLAATQAGSVLALLGLLPLADRGDRRRLLRLQLIALVLALLWLAASRTASWLLSGMLLAGLLGTALTQGLIAYTAMLVPPEQRGRVVGVVQGGVFIGLLLARVVSGTVAAAFGWQRVYLLSAVVMAALAALLWRRLPAVPVPSVPPRWRELLGSMLGMLRRDRTLRERGPLALLLFAGLNVFWAAAPSSFVAAYQLEARQGVGSWQDYGRTDGTNLEIRDIAPGSWSFRVKAVSVLGVSSSWQTSTVEILGLTAPPAQLENVTLQTAGGLAILKWARSADPDVRVGGNIVIRHSKEATATWADSYSMDRVGGGEAIAVVPLKPGTYLVRAEDSGGRAGPEVRVSTKGAQVLAFSPLGMLQADPGFVGSKTGLKVATGTLTLATATVNGVTQVTALEGQYGFAAGLDLGAVKRVRLRSEIGVAALALNDRIDSRTTLMDSWADFDGSAGAEIDVLFEIRETDDDPAVSPNWGPWGRLDNHEIEARAVQARAFLTTKDASYTPIVSQLRLYADEVV